MRTPVKTTKQPVALVEKAPVHHLDVDVQFFRDDLAAALTAFDRDGVPMLTEDERQAIRAVMDRVVEALCRRKKADQDGKEFFDTYDDGGGSIAREVLMAVLGADLGYALDSAWVRLYA